MTGNTSSSNLSRPVGKVGQTAPSVLATVGATLALLPWLSQLTPTQATLCWLEIAITTVGAVRCAHPAARPVGLVTFVFVFSWLGVAPIYQLSHHAAAWGDSIVLVSPNSVPALGLTVLATAAMFIGFERGARSARHRNSQPSSDAEPSRLAAAFYLVACLALTPSAIAANGGISGMLSSRHTRGVLLDSQGLTLSQVGGLKLALIGQLPTALATAAAYLCLLRIRKQARRGLLEVSAIDTVIFLAALPLAFLFANPFTNPRSVTVAALGSLVLLLLQPRRAPAGAGMSAVLLLGTLVLYPLANYFRGASARYDVGLAAFAGIDFDGYQQIINTVSYVHDVGHSWGLYTVSAVLFFIPRSLWTTKAVPASIDVASHHGYSFTNLSLPFNAEMYLEFGVIGMAIIVYVLALAGGRVDTSWLHAPNSKAALLAPYIALAVLSLVRGPLGANTPYYLTPLLLIALGLRRGRGRTTAPPSHRSA